MPILNGFEATEQIRAYEKANPLPRQSSHSQLLEGLNSRIPIFAVSASLYESQRESMIDIGMDGWILKPIEFKRLRMILRGITDFSERNRHLWYPGCSWEAGGWLNMPSGEF
jgi:CheY-like chemotaxis protein